MSFNNIKQDLTMDDYFSNTEKKLILALTESKFLRNLSKIFSYYSNDKKEMLTFIVKLRYGLDGNKEHTLLEISKVLYIEIDEVRDYLVSIRLECRRYYSQKFQQELNTLELNHG